jgi:thymidylate synthase (FAD)
MSLARLIWITPEAEEQIVYCARVSNPKSQEEGKSPDRLIRYLAKHKHWSPFEMASMCVEINTTRDIAAQILRHRSFSFQEFSQRYSATDALGGALVPELRLQDPTNKQNSLACSDPTQWAELFQFTKEIGDLFEEADDLYRRLLDAGVAKECARKVLPLNTPTRLYMSGTIRSWIHYLQIRGGVETQLEHREIAVAIGQIFKTHLPSIHEALLCPTESTLPSAKPNESLLSPPQGVRTGWRLKGFFEKPVNLLKQYLAVLPLRGR